MNGSLGKRLDDIAAEVDALVEAQRRAAGRHLHDGTERTWETLTFLAGPGGIAQCRANVLSVLPLAVARRRVDPSVSYMDAGLPCLPLLVADPPGAGRPGLDEAIDEIEYRWSKDDDEDLEWAACRLVLGDDRGEELRQRCWTIQDGRAVLSSEVVDQSSADMGRVPLSLVGLTGADLPDLAQTARSASPHLATAMVLHDPAPVDEAGRAPSPLEVAVVLDPDPDPPWLSEQGRAVLMDGFLQDLTPAQNALSAAAIVVNRWLWRTAHTHPAARAYRQELLATCSPISLMLARMGIVEPWPKAAKKRHKPHQQT